MRERNGDDATEPCAIMSSIGAIASELGASIVCEGVETEQQRISLLRSGISHIQGFLIARPTDPNELTVRRALRIAS